MSGMILLACLMLAYANGANDNFKGVATLLGSGAANYRRALLWATGTTLAGSLLAVWFAQTLLTRFSGKGLVPDALAVERVYVAAVALAAALTVLFATRLGMPVSTTHALVGGLVGAGLASGYSLSWECLGAQFLAPLLFSPVLAVAGILAVYPVFHWMRAGLGITKQTCFCIGVESVSLVSQLSPCVAAIQADRLTMALGTTVTCQDRYGGHLLGVNAGRFLDGLHYLSSGLVSLARGLNDTPKITALLLASSVLGPFATITLCAAVIAVGGLASARRVAETMSHRIYADERRSRLCRQPCHGFAGCWRQQVGTARFHDARLLRIALRAGRCDPTSSLGPNRSHSLGLANNASVGRPDRRSCLLSPQGTLVMNDRTQEHLTDHDDISATASYRHQSV